MGEIPQDRPLDDEAWVRERVIQVLGPEAAEAWLHEPNQHLEGRSPLKALRLGEGDRVRNYVTALLNGNFL